MPGMKRRKTREKAPPAPEHAVDRAGSMKRRAFLERGIARLSEAGVREADSRMARVAKRWIRPPFALPELDFLLACTRCSACIESCPHGVVFALPKRLGPTFAGTPALDLLNHACRLCDDWPCVTACEPGALRTNAEVNGNGFPKLGVASIDVDRCLPYQGPECGACEASCPVPGALHFENERPNIDAGICVGCGACREACIVEPKAVLLRPPDDREAPRLCADAATCDPV